MSLREMFKPCSREDGCGGYICLFHSLRPEVQAYITQLLAELAEPLGGKGMDDLLQICTLDDLKDVSRRHSYYVNASAHAHGIHKLQERFHAFVRAIEDRHSGK